MHFYVSSQNYLHLFFCHASDWLVTLISSNFAWLSNSIIAITISLLCYYAIKWSVKSIHSKYRPLNLEVFTSIISLVFRFESPRMSRIFDDPILHSNWKCHYFFHCIILNFAIQLKMIIILTCRHINKINYAIIKWNYAIKLLRKLWQILCKLLCEFLCKLLCKILRMKVATNELHMQCVFIFDIYEIGGISQDYSNTEQQKT